VELRIGSGRKFYDPQPSL